MIRPDHPRLFFNRETWPAVKARALGREREFYLAIKSGLDRAAKEHLAASNLPARDRGVQAAKAAFVYRVTGEQPYLELARKYLDSSVRYYEDCFRNRRKVDWYSTSRVHATAAWDWLYESLESRERREWMERLIDAIHNVRSAKPRIPGENYGSHKTGFYGLPNCIWFVGAAAYGAGIREERAREMLEWGYAENMRMLAHRRAACGEHGGAGTSALGYVTYSYPWAEHNFLYTLRSAAGADIAPQWPHIGLLAEYLDWTWIRAPEPLQFGYGDSAHNSNKLNCRELYSHMANTRHFLEGSHPHLAARARALVEDLPPKYRDNSGKWFIHAFLRSKPLMDPLANGPAPAPRPHARDFESMGQVFMRSGLTASDTYCLFACGGIIRQHRHFDALHFGIYRHGFQALDTGSRMTSAYGGVSRDHVQNYFAQTVAHNCMLIHMPDEPAARHAGIGGGTLARHNYGGQNAVLGSVLKAFETNEHFTYVAGDATAVYAAEKCALVTRQLVFLMPNRFVIFDRVVSTRPEYRKVWLIHPASEPKVADGTFRSEHGAGVMFCRTLLPERARFDVVGGPGNEFRTGAVNWEMQGRALPEEEMRLIGQWRLDVSPAETGAEALFLHVIEVGERSLARMVETERVRTPETAGVRFSAAGDTYELTFATKGAPAGHIRIDGKIRLDRDLAGEVRDAAAGAR
ncbi:MAG: heparinase II/III family protein [Kiritimatiellae bacterium]|nr:heparinase II/III family protein [Kiritimatiellia bacterium]